ncbi:MAG: hypothetical protein K5697_09060 [Lachnospiraceae bacterium]|nr:hypothetical protein [Lachnospiraceae bacterium]
MDGHYGNGVPSGARTGIRATENMGPGMPQNMGMGVQYPGAAQGQPAGQGMGAYGRGMNPPGMNPGYGQAVNPAAMNPGYGQGMNPPGMNPSYGQAVNPAGMNPGYAQAANPAGMNPGYGRAVNPARMNAGYGQPGNPSGSSGTLLLGHMQGSLAANASAQPGNTAFKPAGAEPGKAVPPMPAAGKPVLADTAGAAAVKNKSNKGLIIFLLILLGVLLAGGVVALVILMGGNKEILPAKTSASIAVGEELAIRIDNFDDELSDVHLNYESADTKIVTIVREFDDAFIIKGVAEGETELTVSGSGCKSVKIPVTVRGEGDSENE